MADDDRAGYLDRDKKSFSELDQLRRERRDGRDAPRSPVGRQRSEQATRAYLKQADAVFAPDKAGELAAALLDARGTPGLADACRAYRAAAGLPTQARHISCFLDAAAPDVLLAGLEAARSAREGGTLEVTPGLRTQLRMLAQHSDDAVADEAELLLEAL